MRPVHRAPADARRDHRHASFGEQVHGRGAAGQRRDPRFPAIDLGGDLGDQLHNRRLGVGDPWPLGAQDLDLHVAEAGVVQVPPELGVDVVRVLVGHQPEVHLGHGPGWDHRLGALALVAGSDARDVGRGREVGAVDVRDAAQQLFEAEFLHHVGGAFGHGAQEVLFGRGGVPDRVIEAGDQDSLVRSLEARQRPGQAPGGVRQEVGLAGVSIARDRLDRQLDVEKSARAETDDRSLVDLDPALLPDRGVGGQLPFVLLDPVGEMRAADLLLALGEPGDVARVGAGHRPDRC